MFQKIAVLGPGLLGGSVALACRDAGMSAILWGRREERVQATRELGLEATTDIEKAVAEADLIILAVPVGAMTAVTEAMIPHLKKGALVSDVGSVKVKVNQSVGSLLEKAGIDFIGSHPMAGSEQTGVEAARADLLTNAACVITNEANSSRIDELKKFWLALGCRIEELDAADHDRAVARISHFPHAMAVLTAEVGLRTGDEANLAGGGFRDTSRVASGDPTMWAEIMMENRDALIKVIAEAQDSLRDMLVFLEDSDEEGLQKFLAEVKIRRDQVS